MQTKMCEKCISQVFMLLSWFYLASQKTSADVTSDKLTYQFLDHMQCSTQHLIQSNFEVDIKSHFALSIIQAVNTSVSVPVDNSLVFFYSKCLFGANAHYFYLIGL